MLSLGAEGFSRSALGLFGRQFLRDILTALKAEEAGAVVQRAARPVMEAFAEAVGKGGFKFELKAF